MWMRVCLNIPVCVCMCVCLPAVDLKRRRRVVLCCYQGYTNTGPWSLKEGLWKVTTQCPEKNKLLSDSDSFCVLVWVPDSLPVHLSPQYFTFVYCLPFMEIEATTLKSKLAHFIPQFESNFKSETSIFLEVNSFARWVTKNPIWMKLCWEVQIL